MSTTLRPARADELQRAQELIVSSINDLTQRHGFGAMASVRPAAFQLYCFNEDADGFWIAEDEGEIVGSAFSWVCGDLWFLAELFIAPRMQGSGIGRQLLRQALRHADRAGAKTRALITFTFNTVSQGLYVRHGMFPRLPVYMLNVDRKSLLDSRPDARLEFRRAEASRSHLAMLGVLDMSALGVSRESHHKYLLNDPAMRGYFLNEGNDCIGYAYVAATGHVGPLAVVRRDVMAAAFDGALMIAAEGGADRISAFLPGHCETALGVAANHRMRITLPMVLVSDREFGDWTRYLPRNPGFM
ncbi:MAG TPA: GNAT family N-acetyltransferase [Xanthobacteraceae bacterium]|nr:GNAT family N-acetyltransferase [Xanthobacteraceae bacterium]